MRILAEQTDLSYVNEAMDRFHTYWQGRLAEDTIALPTLHQKSSIVLSMSIGNPSIRARVEHVVADTLQKAMSQLKDKDNLHVQKNHVKTRWIKVAFETDTQELKFMGVVEKVVKTRKNYFRSGSAFD